MSEVVFPLFVKFEDGETEFYESIADIEQNLEDFDSRTAKNCEVRDKLGRNVELIVKLLKLEKLTLTTEYNQE